MAVLYGRKHMLKKIFQTTMFLAATSLSVNAGAAIIGTGTESGSVSIVDKEPSTSIYDIFHELIFPQFDEQGGLRTLTEVRLVFTAGSYGTLTWTNTSTTAPTTPDSNVNTVLALSAEQNSTSTLFELLAGGFGGVEYSPGTLAPSASGSATVPSPSNPGELTASSSMTIDGSSSEAFDLVDFVGTGNMTTYLSSIVQIITTTSGTFIVAGDFDSEATLGYEYDYNINGTLEASAPSTFAILGLSMLAVGYSVRRKK